MSLTADSGGRITGQFVIPEGLPVGAKLVEFNGTGTEAAATFIGRGTLKIEDLRIVNTTIVRRVLQRDLDPIAQTFIVPQNDLDPGQIRQVAAVDLWFTAVGPSNLLVQIRETQLGFPTRVVVAESVLRPDEIHLNAWTRFRFTPTALEPGREYVLVVMCDDAIAEVATAGIGEFDAAAQEWVAMQPYQIGVLLSSSNGSTWTAHQTKDLTFRLVTCDYSVDTNTIEEGETTKEVELPSVTVVDADHLMVLAAVERPTAETDVVFVVDVDGTEYSVMEGQPWTLPARYSGAVTWKAVLTGTFTASPILHRDLILVSATRLETSNYVTRLMQCYTGRDVTLYYDALLPGTATVAAKIEDEESEWEDFPLDDVAPTIELGDGWVEYKHKYTLLSTRDETRIELLLTGHARMMPLVRNIRVAIT
jgi:hypothetical protein